MSAARWKLRDDDTVDKPPLLASVGFIYAGLEKLLPGRKSDLRRVPYEFIDGAEARSALNQDVGPSE